ncbi:MAG: PD40 domain-containing protein [Armatimonadetes bacterium]|nr:PD40 domain-containing protein [Armatimonadota bacterium]
MNADGSDQRNLTNNPADDFDPSFAPDGSRIAFVSDRNGGNQLFVMDSDGGNVKQLTLPLEGGIDPRWSNDGAKIAYTRGVDLAVIDATGGDPTVILEARPAGDEPCRTGAFPGGWSPDDSRITYYSAGASSQVGQVCTIGADGSQIEVVVGDPPALHVEPVWSPDGRYIAYRSVRNGIHDVWVRDLESEADFNLTNSADIDLEPAWSPDGEWLALAVLVAGEPQSDIYIMRRDGSDLRRLTDDSAADSYPAWSP